MSSVSAKSPPALLSTHQVRDDKLSRVPLPKGAAIREVRHRQPKRDVERVIKFPARVRVTDVLYERLVVVVVNDVTVDMAKHVPHLLGVDVAVEVVTLHATALDPEI